jgi:hypothetical protein
MKRLWAPGLIGAMAAVAIAGCGSSSSSSHAAAARTTAATSAATTIAATTTAAATAAPFLSGLKQVTTLGSTVPANGDINPYGIVQVATSVGRLSAGDFLVSNFNDKANNQGTGTTIDQLTAAGKDSLFATVDARDLHGNCPGGVGLTTALNVLPGGYVVVGSLPTTNGKSATARFGCLIVLDSQAHTVGTIAGPQIAGPWDMTAVSSGADTTLFVSNALNGGAN